MTNKITCIFIFFSYNLIYKKVHIICVVRLFINYIKVKKYWLEYKLIHLSYISVTPCIYIMYTIHVCVCTIYICYVHTYEALPSWRYKTVVMVCTYGRRPIFRKFPPKTLYYYIKCHSVVTLILEKCYFY